jgi:hypothetical protein
VLVADEVTRIVNVLMILMVVSLMIYKTSALQGQWRHSRSVSGAKLKPNRLKLGT